MNPNQSVRGPDWASLVERIRSGDASADAELCGKLGSFRWYLKRNMNGDDEDAFQELMMDLLIRIRRGDLREPARLIGFARVVARRKVAAYIDGQIQSRQSQQTVDNLPWLADSGESPETAAIRREREEIIGRILEALPVREREILQRFYLLGHDAGRICAEMSLTYTQFRLIKTRVKARFTMLCANRLAARRGPGRNVVAFPGALRDSAA